MKKIGVILKKAAAAAVMAAVFLTAVFLIGRYGWKLLGFSACQSAGIEAVEVTDGQVKIKGFYPGSFPQGFLGYHAEEQDGTLYVGFRFSGLFGIFETGDFDITIPVSGELTQVIIKTRNYEHPIWPEGGSTQALPSEEAAQDATPAAYEAVISDYRTALTEGWSGQQLVDQGLNHMIRDVLPEAVGYTVTDLDGDGIPELAIGTLSGDAFYGRLIFLLYTLDDRGDAVLIFSSTERDLYYYAGGTRFANIGASGAADSFETTRKLEDKALVDMAYTTDPSDYVQMELIPIV